MFAHVFFALLTLPLVRADGWDNFSNNLATDLAPFLSLFGEQITKQYLSESTSHLDYLIFAIAPMGILTAVVSAIRVCGSPSLRAFIGRAQEGAGNAEAELCSSTSRDVCELYNNGGIARVFGRPKILEVVHDPNHDFSDSHDETAGIYTFQDYVTKKGKELWQKEKPKKKQKDAESALEPETPHTAFAPNLSLNIGIKKQHEAVFWVIALVGLILQAGVLVFAGVVTYYLKWKKDDGSLPDSYACPLVIIGTLLVCGGMFHCAFLVGQSTEEDVWLRKEEDTDKSSMYWLQPGGQIIGDQTFDAFSHTDCDNRLKKYTTSRRKNGLKESRLQVWAAVGITLSGFVLQFTGLRGIHSAVSVAQLGVILVMSTARAALRMQRFGPDANPLANFPDEVLGHELDWLALRIGRDVIKKDLDCPSPSLSFKSSSVPSSPDTSCRYFWRFRGALDPTNGTRLENSPPHEPRNAAAILLAYRTRLASLTVSSTAPARTFKSEMVEVRRESLQLADLIEATMNTIFSKAEVKGDWKEAQSIFWGIDCSLSSQSAKVFGLKKAQHGLHQHFTASFREIEDATIPSKRHIVYLELTREPVQTTLGSSWRFRNRLELEGLLGLWVWSLKSDPTIETKDLETGLTKSTAADIKARRIVSTDQIMTESDFGIWLGGDINNITKCTLDSTSTDLRDASTVWTTTDKEETWEPLSAAHAHPPRVRFFGWNVAQLSQIQAPKTSSLWSAPTNNSLLSLCTQEVFASFITSVLDVVDDFGSVDIQKAEPFRLENSLVTEILKLFTDMRLGSSEEALMCVVPVMLPRLNMPSAASALAIAWKNANQDRKRKEWKKAEARLQWAWNICTKSRPTPTNTVDEGETPLPILKDALVEQATIAVGELYRWALVDQNTEAFGLHGIKWLENQKSGQSKSTCDVIDRYAAISNSIQRDEVSGAELLTAMDNGCLTTTLLSLTRLASSVENKQKGTALLLAANHGWVEVTLALLELRTEPNFRDLKSKRTPLSYAAEQGSVDVVRELIDWGSVPNSEDSEHRTPLSYAAEAGAGMVAEILLRDLRVSPDSRDGLGRTPLWLAARNGHKAVVKQLLETGVDPDMKDNQGGTPLWTAASSGYEAVVEQLLETGMVHPDPEDTYGHTPLWIAASNGHEAVVKHLLETGVDPDTKDNEGRTPLWTAASSGYEAIVKQLLETGKVDPNAKSRSGQTPIMRAAYSGHEAVVKQLLETGKVDPGAEDEDRRTPLWLAASRGHEAVVKQLLETGKVDPNAKDRSGRTPLWIAAYSGHEAVAKQLLETGKAKVDPDAKGIHEQTLLSWAKMYAPEAIVKQVQ